MLHIKSLRVLGVIGALACLCPSVQAASFDGTCKAAPTVDVPQGAKIVEVDSEPALQLAMSNLQDNTVLLLAPGEYRLTSTLWINGRDDITIRGDSTRCDAVVLIGRGMENATGSNAVPHGIWANGARLRIQNLTIRDVYYHAVSLDGNADSPWIYNVRMVDTGQQFVKANPRGFADGVDNGKVEFSVLTYSAGPPRTDHGGGTGYTNGVDVHAGRDWVISNNHFENFHTPDDADNLWNPAILVWNGASGTIVDANTFVDVDRAIAFGLLDRYNDHRGGVIRNNMITMRPGLYSANRQQQSDAAILVWSSPETQVLHNTVMTQGNLSKSIELRFNSNDATLRNNLVSAPISDRSSNYFVDRDNIRHADMSVFVDPVRGDLHLKAPVDGISGSVPVLSDAATDFDGDVRSSALGGDAGADQIVAESGGGGECRVRVRPL